MNKKNFLICRVSCLASHNPAYCSLINCQFHILLIVDKDRNELIGTLQRLCVTFQHVDCFYTLFKYRFFGIFMLKNGNILVSVERTVSFNKLNEGVDKMPIIAKKSFLRKNNQKGLADSKAVCSSNEWITFCGLS